MKARRVFLSSRRPSRTPVHASATPGERAFHRVRPHAEALQRVRGKGRAGRDVGSIAPAREPHALEARCVVAATESLRDAMPGRDSSPSRRAIGRVATAIASLHRMHHAYSDTPKDPHSPRSFAEPASMMWATKERHDAICDGTAEVEPRFLGGYPEWPTLDRIGNP
ncbi:hypothetical protein [Sorangium sp. So ce1000]|uniref:hypothetical protein n=1 Tax=Sorangium sp. So ce1000 TaxID=3133325 RepID=UPI003F5F9174